MREWEKESVRGSEREREWERKRDGGERERGRVKVRRMERQNEWTNEK